MRKMILMALAGFLWKKIRGGSVKPATTGRGFRRY